MEDAREHALVVLALTGRLSNCVMWVNDKTARRVAEDPDLRGTITPRGIILDTRDFVRTGGVVEQVRETRPEYRDRYRFYYKAIVPIPGLHLPLFVEMRLTDDDPDCPVVMLVNAHLQRPLP